MTRCRVRSALFALGLCASAPSASAAIGQAVPSSVVGSSAFPDATLFRVFLKDGSSLVSYGEVARVDDHVVFTMPTSTSSADPQLHLVNLAADRVDWDRTAKYAESARASQYLANQAVYDYAQLSNGVAQALNEIAATKDPVEGLAIAEEARKILAEWPPKHFNYKQADVHEMLGMLDEAIGDLRVAAGTGRFDLSFVADAGPPPPVEPLMAPPTPQETIEQVLTAADLSDSPAERSSLLAVALSALARDAGALPPEWATSTAAATEAAIAREIEADRAYQTLTSTVLGLARTRARAADVNGLQRLIVEVHVRDFALGARRPDAVNALLDSIAVELDAARRLRLARDQWTLRAPEYRKYRASILASLTRFTQLKAPLENIKALAGSSPFALSSILRAAAEIRGNMSKVSPPGELQQTHSLLMSAVELADSAARIRREAALTGSITRAWDASAAAAGSLMLVARALSEMQALLKIPQLPK
jgi:hypothetical protein